MVSKITLNIAKRIMQKGRGDLLLFGLIYFLAARRNLYCDKLRYDLCRMIHRNDFKEVEVNGYLMRISLQDKGISRELYLHRKREHFSTDLMFSFINENDIIIDIGANIGYYALLESKLVKNGKIFAIEPVPSNLNLLENNILVNKLKNISTHQLAISDSNTINKMYIYDKCNWCSFNKNLDGSQLGELDVISMTLDKFVETYVCTMPTFIRMDLEGYEYQAIKGACEIIGKGQPLKLNIEFHPHLISNENMGEIISTLKKNDFIIKAITLNPPTHIYRNLNLFNKLRIKLGYPEYGIINGSYDELERILENNFDAPIVFFEKTVHE